MHPLTRLIFKDIVVHSDCKDHADKIIRQWIEKKAEQIPMLDNEVVLEILNKED